MFNLKKPSIIVHGGAGRWKVDEELRIEVEKAVYRAVQNAFDMLSRGASAIEAVIEAIKVMEDSGVLNAGVGSVLNLVGFVEMDAGLMDGKTLRAAGVAAVRYPRNPIVLAYKVMELTDHVLMVGSEADRFAEKLGLAAHPGVSDRIQKRYKELLRNIDRVEFWKKLDKILAMYRDAIALETVGAVALDRDGNVAAGASTGGVWLKLPGRVGDSPIPGAGFYADNRGGGVSASGLGEVIIMTMPSRKAVEMMRQGINAERACIDVVQEVTRIYGRNTVGLVCLDVKGIGAVVHNTERMLYAVMSMNLDRPILGFEGIRIT